MDLDIDIEANKRQEVLSALRNYFGEDKVLQVATYGTQGSKSAIKTAARGLGIEDTEAQHIASYIPTERGEQWSISDCLYGNVEKDRSPIKKFKQEMKKYKGLLETSLKLEGIVTQRSIHAGGIIIFNEDIYKHNALMTATRGEAKITQFNLQDSEQIGGVKYDLLSVENLDRIRNTLDLLVADEEIDMDKGLRETFKGLLHPKNLNLEDREYFTLASTGKINDLFQFQTEIGQNTLKKVKPETFEEFCAANSLMRLQSDGTEQPIDVFIRYKNNIDLWYKDMEDFGLTEEEIGIMEEHLLAHRGVNATQEVSMAMSADPRISGFNIIEQNKLRKTIAKPRGSALDEVRKMFYEKGKKCGASKTLLDYVWNVQFFMQFSYSFSQLHVTAYSIIGIQNLELYRKFDPLYWQTACLNVDSGSLGDAQVDYSKMATAMGKMQAQGVQVTLPSVNHSGFAFVPNIEKKQIVYGLKSIKSISMEMAQQIIAHRPYNSLEDFLDKAYKNFITDAPLICLVKSGALDEFGERREIMKEVIRFITPTKDKYNLQSVNMIVESGALDDHPDLPILKLRNKFFKKVIRKYKANPSVKTEHRIFKVEDMEEYSKYFGQEAVVDVHPNYYEVDEKPFSKIYEKKIKNLKKYVSTKEVADRVNRHLLNENWKKHALGTEASWEMDTISYYFHPHELSHIDKDTYGISNFYDLRETPRIVEYYKWKGREFSIYETTQVCGTVVGKNDNKHTVFLLGEDGVFSVKFYGNAYSHFAKQTKRNGTIVEKSWFSRGTKLLIHGFRRGSQFIPKVYKHSFTDHDLKLIEHIDKEGIIRIRTERL